MKKIAIMVLATTLLLWSADTRNCKEELFSLATSESETGDITIGDVVKDLAGNCHFSIIYLDEGVRTMLRKPLDTTNLKDLTLLEMFSFLLGDHNIFYDFDEDRGVLRLAYVRTRSFHIDYVNLSELKTESVKSITVGASGGLTATSNGTTSESGSNGDNSDHTTITTTTEFKFWNNFKSQIDAILQRDEDMHTIRTKALINKEAGIVTVTGTKKQLLRVERYIKEVMQRLHRQIMIEAKIIELRYADSNTSGINWSQFDLAASADVHDTYERGVSPANRRPYYSFSYNFTMNGLLDFLQHYGHVNTLSNPKIMTLNNQPAIINVGDQFNYKYQTGEITTTTTGNPVGTNTYELGSVFVGLTLNIVPEVTDNGYIILKVNPVISEQRTQNEALDAETTSPASATSVREMPPDVKIKQLTSIVRVRNGQKVIIGGLMSNKTIRANSKVPLLGDIPLLGRAFHHTGYSTSKVELIIILKPSIIQEEPLPAISDIVQVQRGK